MLGATKTGKNDNPDLVEFVDRIFMDPVYPTVLKEISFTIYGKTFRVHRNLRPEEWAADNIDNRNRSMVMELGKMLIEAGNLMILQAEYGNDWPWLQDKTK